MHIARMFAALCFVVLASSVFAVPLPKGDLPAGYEHWEKRSHPCTIKKGVTVNLETFTLRSAEAIMSGVSIWYVNGEPIEAKYMETVPEPTSLSGYRTVGYSVALDKNGKWVKLGDKTRSMTNNERILLRLSRFAHLERFGVTEREFTSAFAACNRDRPGELR